MSDKFSLIVISGPENGKEATFSQDTVNIGRSQKDNDLVINDSAISRKHARINFENDNYVLQDLGSANRTYFKGKPLEKYIKVALHDGDEFSMGKTIIRFNTLLANGLKTETFPSTDIDLSKQNDKQPSFLAQILNKRYILFTMIAVICLLVFSLIFKLFLQSPPKSTSVAKAPKQPTTSMVPIPIPANGTYGYTKVLKSHYDKAIFTFSGESKWAKLSYKAGGINIDGEVLIILNGTQVAKVPLVLDGWGAEETIDLPGELILEGKDNTLIFDNILNPPKFETWAVKDLKIEFLKSDLCDRVEGERLFSLAEETYKEKSIRDENLFIAANYYSEAINRVQGCSEPKPPFFNEAASKLKNAKEELENRYNDLQYGYKKSIKMNDYLSAKEYLEGIIHLIPDKKDPKNIEADRLIKKINRIISLRRK